MLKIYTPNRVDAAHTTIIRQDLVKANAISLETRRDGTADLRSRPKIGSGCGTPLYRECPTLALFTAAQGTHGRDPQSLFRTGCRLDLRRMRHGNRCPTVVVLSHTCTIERPLQQASAESDEHNPVVSGLG